MGRDTWCKYSIEWTENLVPNMHKVNRDGAELVRTKNHNYIRHTKSLTIEGSRERTE